MTPVTTNRIVSIYDGVEIIESKLRNGNIASLLSYKNGKMHGFCQWFANNKLTLSGNYINGRQRGIYISYFYQNEGYAFDWKSEEFYF